MQKIILKIIFFGVILQFLSCSSDINNFTPPNWTIHGALLYKSTTDTLYTTNNTQGYTFPDGILNVFQQNYSQTAARPQGTTFQNLSPNTTYYIRAGAKATADDPQGYWNYSKILKIKL